MALETNSPGQTPGVDASTPVRKAKRGRIVNLEPLPAELQQSLKSTRNVSGHIDDFKGAVFETKRDPKIQFHIKQMTDRSRFYLIKVTGDEKQTRRKEKGNRGHSFQEKQIRNFSINWNVDKDLIEILLRKIAGRENSEAKLHQKEN